MEHITPLQLQKYRTILDQINAEHTKQESLQNSLTSETNKYLAMRVVVEEAFAKEHVFKTLVKVYDSVYDIFYIYGHNRSLGLEMLSQFTNHKFYVVQVFISKLFEGKIMNHKWLLSVCIHNNRNSITKNVYLETIPCLVAVPFDKSVEPVIVTTVLYMQLDKFSNAIKISTTHTDISYHFASQASSQEVEKSLLVSKLYNKYLPELKIATQPIEYTFKCKCETIHFFESLIKNCYHRMNPVLFSAFAPDQDVINVNLALLNSSTVIKLDKVDQVLSIISDFKYLHQIKMYFIEGIGCQEVTLDLKWLIALKKLRHYLRRELKEDPANIQSLNVVYKELRKLMCDLPI